MEGSVLTSDTERLHTLFTHRSNHQGLEAQTSVRCPVAKDRTYRQNRPRADGVNSDSLRLDDLVTQSPGEPHNSLRRKACEGMTRERTRDTYPLGTGVVHETGVSNKRIDTGVIDD